MSNSCDDQTLQAEFYAVAKALAREIKKAVNMAAIEPADSATDSLTDEERLLASVHSRQPPAELGRLIGHLQEIGVELRARDLLPSGTEALT